MKMYLKVIGVVHVILAFPKLLLLLKELRRWWLLRVLGLALCFWGFSAKTGVLNIIKP